jgi:hypothetical protein
MPNRQLLSRSRSPAAPSSQTALADQEAAVAASSATTSQTALASKYSSLAMMAAAERRGRLQDEPNRAPSYSSDGSLLEARAWQKTVNSSDQTMLSDMLKSYQVRKSHTTECAAQGCNDAADEPCRWCQVWYCHDHFARCRVCRTWPLCVGCVRPPTNHRCRPFVYQTKEMRWAHLVQSDDEDEVEVAARCIRGRLLRDALGDGGQTHPNEFIH